MDEILYEVNNPSTINKEISADEIMEAIKQLKYHKAAGVDRVVNEYIKSTATLLMPVYVKLLNTIFYNEDLPNEWHTGIIIPFFLKTKEVGYIPKITDQSHYFAAALNCSQLYLITV